MMGLRLNSRHFDSRAYALKPYALSEEEVESRFFVVVVSLFVCLF